MTAGFVLLAFGLVPEGVWAQGKTSLRSERVAAQAAERVDRQIAKASRRLQNVSFRSFTRGGMGTGNLIQVPYVNNVNISAGYWGGAVSPNLIQWPRNSGVEYGHTMSFIVGAEVVSDDGDSLTILSDSYNRSGGDQAPDGSHKYFFNPLPGYYNMQGATSTENQLNNNPADRALLDESGFYYVGGLSEPDLDGDGELDPIEDLNNNGERDAELQNRIEYAAQSNLPETWPAFWPPQSYPGDTRALGQAMPGPRAGRWNGAFGAFARADQESYYVADDRDNDEFAYYPFINPQTGQPDTRSWSEGGRRGIGVEVDVRQYQWASVLAEDIFITTLDVKNVSRKDIPRTIISMIVDYDIAGQTGDNEALFNTEDDITYQWLKRDLTLNGFKVGYAGVGFLESPGISNDGIDNDGDGLVDEDRENGIDDDGDWRTWTDVNGNGTFDNEDVNNNFRLDSGEDLDGDGALTIEPLNDDVGSDGLGPEDENYPGPDANGTEANGLPDPGEPNFEFTDNDEIDQIGLTGMVIRTPAEFDRDLDDDALFWRDYIQPGTFILPTETADIIYVYSSGYTAIQQDQTQRFSIAFFCGNDFQDMLRNKRTMQNIYDADYNFARPPRRPFLTAIPGDGRVTLVWDQSAEASRDPIYGFDFEMYKVYRSTDPEFDAVKTITDAFGNPLLWEPLQTSTGDDVQFDLENGLAGAHPVPIGDFGISYDMGTDSGLQYSYVDSTVENGRTYYYAVVAVDQGYDESFFERGISEFEGLAEISPTESPKVIEVDAFGRPTNVDRNTAVVVPQPGALGYVEPHLAEGGVGRSGDATGGLDVDFLIPDSANSRGYEYAFTFTDDGTYAALDECLLEGGQTTGFTLRNVTTGDTLATATAQPGEDLFSSPLLTAQTYDGMRFSITNPAVPEPIQTTWLENNSAERRSAVPQSVMTVDAPGDNTAVPIDYEIRVTDVGADTSISLDPRNRVPTNFALHDVTDPNATGYPCGDLRAGPLPFQLDESGGPLIPGDTARGVLSPGDVINARIVPVDFSGYDYYAQSTWRFTLELSPSAQRTIERVTTEANALYSALAADAVRGLQVLPYGPDLDAGELDAFYRRIGGWYDGIRDSLGALPNAGPLVSLYDSPSAYLQTFEALRTSEIPVSGDRFLFRTSKPFDRDDVLRFTVEGNQMEETLPETALDEIYVVPDPYVAVNPLETRNVILSGRSERRIDFRNLPRDCTIRIFTISGRPVKTIRHSAPQDRSFATWNLQSDDGLDVAYGVYVYHVNAPGIGEKVGRFAIIK